MRHRRRLLTALAAVFALGVTQGCYGPVPRQLAQIEPEQRVYLSRTSGFTLHHYADSLETRPLECTLRRATARVRSITEEWIVVDQIEVTSLPLSGDCRLGGTAWVVRADVPDLDVSVRGPSTVRTAVFVVIGIPLLLGSVAVLLMFATYE